MNTAVREVIKTAIETKRREIAELESALKRLEAEDNTSSGRMRRRRRSGGFKQGSVPYLVNEILAVEKSPMTAADLAEALKKKGKNVTTNILAGSLNRYMGKMFDRTEDGSYVLLEAH